MSNGFMRLLTPYDLIVHSLLELQIELVRLPNYEAILFTWNYFFLFYVPKCYNILVRGGLT